MKLRWKLTAVILFVAWIGNRLKYFPYHPRQYSTTLNTTAFLPDLQIMPLWFVTEDGNQSAIILSRRHVETLRVTLVFGGIIWVARDWIDLLADLFLVTPAWNDVAFVLVDYPGYGDSDGTPSKLSMVRSGVGALIKVTTIFSIENATVKFGALGHSIGCAVALEVAAAQQNADIGLEHISISAPFTSILALAQAKLRFLEFVPNWILDYLFSKIMWDNVDAGSRLAALPSPPRIDIIHGDNDTHVPKEHGIALSSHFQTLGLHAAFNRTTADHTNIVGSEDYRAWLQTTLW